MKAKKQVFADFYFLDGQNKLPQRANTAGSYATLMTINPSLAELLVIRNTKICLKLSNVVF